MSEALRANIRMAALVVMAELGEEDKALATAIAAKAAEYVAPMLRDSYNAGYVQARRDADVSPPNPGAPS